MRVEKWLKENQSVMAAVDKSQIMTYRSKYMIQDASQVTAHVVEVITSRGQQGDESKRLRLEKTKLTANIVKCTISFTSTVDGTE